MILNIYTIPLLISASITIALFFVVWQRRAAPGAWMVLAFFMAMLIWTIGYVFELSSTDFNSKLYWAKIQYFGIASVSLFFLFFVFDFFELPDRPRWPVLVTLALPPILTVILVWTNQWHQMMWLSADLSEDNPYLGLIFTRGPAFWIHTVYSYLLILSSIYYIVQSWRSPNYMRSRQASIVFFAPLIPLLSNAIYLLHLSPIPGLDLTPLAFAATGVVIAIGLFQYRFLDLVPIARNRIVETLIDPVIVVDPQNRVIDMNAAAEKLLSPARKSEIIAAPAASILPWKALVDRLSTPDTRSASLPIRLMMGTSEDRRIYEAMVSLIQDQKGRTSGRLITLRDVTQREKDASIMQENEVQLREMVQQLQELDLLKTRFIRNINHELRTPLTNIGLYVGLLSTGKSENRERYLQVLEREVSTLQRLIEETLNLDQLSAGQASGVIERTPISLSHLIQNAVDLVAPRIAAKGIHLAYVSALLPYEVIGDTVRLRKVFSELLTNALNFTKRGGSITVTATLDGEMTVVSIRDTGPGIPEYEQQSIFERFYRGEQATLNSIPGLGLGLSTVKSIVEMHGGRITLFSELGKGSTFTVYLPLAPKEPFPHAESEDTFKPEQEREPENQQADP